MAAHTVADSGAGGKAHHQARLESGEMIDPAARIGAVHLTVSDLARAVSFYETRLGLSVGHHAGSTASVGAGRGRELLVLSESRSAPRPRGTTGLFHFAILVPARRDLADALRRLLETGTTLQGASDHGVSEALYLADPDGNGIEIYRDRPRQEWPMAEGRLRMGTDPLDLENLLGEGEARASVEATIAAGTTMGHVHLHVADLEAARQFYVDVLGFDLRQRYGSSALFMSAGGYHHHIAVNTWAGVGAPPPPPGAVGLRHFEVRLSGRRALEEVTSRLDTAGVPVDSRESGVFLHDPSRNGVMLSVAE
jgi:catechol 2,3-dioxygenase